MSSFSSALTIRELALTLLMRSGIVVQEGPEKAAPDYEYRKP
jgi:hypothetical protein